MIRLTSIFVVVIFSLVMTEGPAFAESQDQEYTGVSDPFGDPSNYEFAEDEKEDKEFFHLGRYLMFGLDAGIGIFTGELGRTTGPAFYVGLKILYFFDKAIALEFAGHFANHLEIVESQAGYLEIETNLIPITLGFRYYFDTKSAPKAIAIANPYLAFGGGGYIRQQNVLANQGFDTSGNTTTSSFGGYGGGGVEFTIYRKHIYFGIDLRYHLIFFLDEETRSYAFQGDGAGDYVTGAATLTYNF